MAQIRRQYLNPKFAGSFAGISTFLKNRKFKDSNEVTRELKKHPPYYIHAPSRKLFPRRRVVTIYPNFLWGADLIGNHSQTIFQIQKKNE